MEIKYRERILDRCLRAYHLAQRQGKQIQVIELNVPEFVSFLLQVKDDRYNLTQFQDGYATIGMGHDTLNIQCTPYKESEVNLLLKEMKESK